MGSRNVYTRRAGCAALAVVASLFGAPRASWAESIVLLGPVADVNQGSAISVLVLLTDNTTNLVSYSLDVDVFGEPASVGNVAGLGDPPSNFFESRNLIEQDPDDALHPLFSVIATAADGGVFFSALSQSLTTVDLAVPGTSDILGQVFFDVSPDALGTYHIALGPATGLFDGESKIPFDTNTLTIDVVPEPAAAVALAGFLLLAARTRRRASWLILN